MLSAMSIFFGNNTANLPPGVMTEVACEPMGTCNSDNFAFKGLTAQWMGATTQIAPFTRTIITTYLQESAKGAATQCTQKNGVATCGAQWTKSTFDGKTGVGQQLIALNVVVANLATNASAPATANITTGSSTSSTSSSSTTATGHPSTTVKSASSNLLPLCTAASTVSLLIFATLALL